MHLKLNLIESDGGYIYLYKIVLNINFQEALKFNNEPIKYFWLTLHSIFFNHQFFVLIVINTWKPKIYMILFKCQRKESISCLRLMSILF